MAIKDILIGDKKYKIETLSVLDSLDFQIEFTTGLGGFLGKLAAAYATVQNGKEVSKDFLDTLFDGVKPEALKAIKKKAFAQVYTPENRCLSDEAYLENWFSREENKGDVWTVLQQATITLLGEYMPGFVKKLMEMGQEKISAIQKRYASQNDTDVKP